VGRVAGLEELRGTGRVLVATVAAGGEPPGALERHADVALLIGSEAAGLPGEVRDAADALITIPMPGGTESLNAAAAGAILAYHLAVRDGGGRP
jgi:TrmH family RNA methyltransferase